MPEAEKDLLAENEELQRQILLLRAESGRRVREVAEEYQRRIEFLWALIDTVPDWLYVKDANLRFLFVNQSMADAFQLPPHEFVGKTSAEIYPQKDLAYRIQDADREVLETLKEKVLLDGPEVAGDGRTIWLQRIKKPLMSPDGCTWHILGVTSDITAIKENELRLQESQSELEMQLKRLDRAWRQTITALASTSETKDPYTAGHQRRVAELAVAIGNELGFTEDGIVSLSLAGAVHDIGKIVVPGEILSKPSRLSQTERKLIETHSHAGHDILKDLDLPWPIADIVHQHHERMDGSGYPFGLKAEAICIEARIIAVADVVESMMSHRPYRKALGQEAALAEIEAGRDKLYDSSVVDTCLELFRYKRFSFQ